MVVNEDIKLAPIKYMFTPNRSLNKLYIPSCFVNLQIDILNSNGKYLGRLVSIKDVIVKLRQLWLQQQQKSSLPLNAIKEENLIYATLMTIIKISLKVVQPPPSLCDSMMTKQNF
jgi:hypothetical protein